MTHHNFITEVNIDLFGLHGLVSAPDIHGSFYDLEDTWMYLLNLGLINWFNHAGQLQDTSQV